MPSTPSPSVPPAAAYYQPDPDPGRAARAIAEAVNAEVGAPVVRRGAGPSIRLPPLSTGYPALDAATGHGGLPRGASPRSSAAPPPAARPIATRSVAGSEGDCAWMDVVGLVDVDAMARAGVNLDRLYILRPPAPLDALAIAGQVIAGGGFDVVVLDSLADLPPGAATARALALRPPPTRS